ncbi:NlpC/P60 family protein [Actibacterium lipolyticum]|uniref:Putative peptidoglycan binding domain protein n=1 Tax=Actibacterium lipolyticum TaxID=1524263 RepID=A0A238KP42_9RHOB|nr:peptidoglycan-binding protein [Actibacterium lipolyticum]SMX44410.1 Putative peptidoglycan binding domain protein [Actibacterium lipolyticum]
MITVRMVQERLAELGYDPGPIDGLRGRRTIVAVQQFQRDSGLVEDGLVGPATASALFNRPMDLWSVPDGEPWIDVAERMRGLHEDLDRAELSEFLKSDGGSAGDPSQVPWCADFVQTCIALSMPAEPLPNNPYVSANWVRFGKPVIPCQGAILCFWRENPESWKGHVGFMLGEDEEHFLVLGGNQANRVSEMPISKALLRENGCRWPATALASSELTSLIRSRSADFTLPLDMGGKK